MPTRARSPEPSPLSASQKVELYVKEALYHGALKPRERILEVELARRLGCSRAPVREALLRLAREGLIVTLPRRGTFVRDLAPQEIEECFEMRAKLEGLCARYMRLRSGDRAARMLRECLKKMEAAAVRGDDKQFLRADMMLHRTIWKLSRCQEIYRTLNSIMSPLILLVARTTSERVPLKEALAHHKDYVEIVLQTPAGRVEQEVERYFMAVFKQLYQSDQPSFEWRSGSEAWLLAEPALD